jgi:hypothetical protein
VLKKYCRGLSVFQRAHDIVYRSERRVTQVASLSIENGRRPREPLLRLASAYFIRIESYGSLLLIITAGMLMEFSK